jgi:hypothetical protein
MTCIFKIIELYCQRNSRTVYNQISIFPVYILFSFWVKYVFKNMKIKEYGIKL